jgi:hypothetical protein
MKARGGIRWKGKEAINVLKHLATMYPKVEMTRKKAAFLPSLVKME